MDVEQWKSDIARLYAAAERRGAGKKVPRGEALEARYPVVRLAKSKRK